MADALDVRHRLPKLWAELMAGRVRVWQARHVASRTRATGLSLGQARQVDETHHAVPGVAPADPVGARRSKALGILAHPARALTLLQSAGSVGGNQVSTGSTTDEAEPTTEGAGALRGASSLGDLVSTGSTTDVPLPAATLYVHVSKESMETGDGVARMEGVGPITIGQASEFLRHSHVTIKPVIDLDEDRPVDCYEVPDRLRDQMHLRSPASAFPFSSATGRRMDLDHTMPFRVSTGSTTESTGPPGQTRIGNLGKLTRFEHRIKTHGKGWRHRQPEPGVHHWRTPLGYQFTVDHTGTHRVSTGSTTGRGSTSDTAYERAFAGLLRHW